MSQTAIEATKKGAFDFINKPQSFKTSDVEVTPSLKTSRMIAVIRSGVKDVREAIEKAKKTILQAITDVQTGNLKPLNEQWLETFTRKAIAESLANKIDSLLDQDPVN